MIRKGIKNHPDFKDEIFRPYWTKGECVMSETTGPKTGMVEEAARKDVKIGAEVRYLQDPPDAEVVRSTELSPGVTYHEVASATPPPLGSCLDEAKATICGERQDQYGNPEDSFARIAEYWSVYLEKLVSPLDVAHMMMLLKLGRCQGQGFRRDSYVDLAGYASIAADRLGEV